MSVSSTLYHGEHLQCIKWLRGHAEMPETAAAEDDAKADAADEDMADPPVKVARSRWLDEEPEEEPPETVNKVQNDIIQAASLTAICLHVIYRVPVG